MKQQIKTILCLALILALMLSAAATAFAAPEEAENREEQIPRITQITPVQGGVKISFTAYDGAYKYRVFTKKADGSGWKGIGDTAALSFTRTGIAAYATDLYTVRALDSKGKFVSGYDKDGYLHTYLPAPALVKAESVYGGVKVTWNPVEGVQNYRLYVRNGSGWRGILTTSSTSCLDTGVVSGSSYTYTVRAYDDEGVNPVSYFDRGGVTAQYIEAPQITSCTPVQGGVKVSWNAVGGAVRYRLFYKNGSGWKTIGSTSSTSYTHTDPIAGQEYTYTVRVTDLSGRYISGYDKTGYTSSCLSAPVLRKAQSVYGGVKVSWDAVAGAQSYRVYVKNVSSWKGILNTDATEYLDTNVESGARYTYTVRAVDPDSGEMRSYFDRSGVSALYVAAPAITSCSPTDGGVRVTWNAVKGAVRYRLFYQNGSSWKTIGTTADTSMNVAGLTAGREYVYTVRVVDGSGSFISGYDAQGFAYRYIAAPAVASVAQTGEGVTLRWDAVPGAAAYRVYRKDFGSVWTKIADTAELSYTDPYSTDTLCAYTLRTLDVDGQLSSYYLNDTPYYHNGVLADGTITYRGAKLIFSKGSVRQGYVTVDGKTRYYNAEGVLMKNGIVGSAQEGWRYADKDGVIDTTARLAVSQDGYDWNVLDGVAHRVTTAKDRTMHRALKLVAKLTASSMTKAQKLRACFDYLQTETYEYNPRVPHYRGMDWPVIYADDIFTTGGGNCLSYAAAFAFMAKAIGYEDVYGCHSGGHGWTEIGGLIYDTEWQRSHHTYSYYGLSYYTDTDVDYLGVKVNFPSNAWMHVAI